MKGALIKVQRFWFCHDGLNHCLGKTSRKYAFDRPTLLSLWHVQARINLIQIEVVTLEEASFLFLKKARCPLVNQVGDNTSTPLNQPLTCAPLKYVW
jgi:hypothetical protein